MRFTHRIRAITLCLIYRVAAHRGVRAEQPVRTTVLRYCCFNIVQKKCVATLLLEWKSKFQQAKVKQCTAVKIHGSKRVWWERKMNAIQYCTREIWTAQNSKRPIKIEVFSENVYEDVMTSTLYFPPQNIKVEVKVLWSYHRMKKLLLYTFVITKFYRGKQHLGKF